jgi:hypothetical protein
MSDANGSIFDNGPPLGTKCSRILIFMRREGVVFAEEGRYLIIRNTKDGRTATLESHGVLILRTVCWLCFQPNNNGFFFIHGTDYW